MRRLKHAAIVGLVAFGGSLVFAIGKGLFTGAWQSPAALFFVSVAVGVVAAVLDLCLYGKPKHPASPPSTGNAASERPVARQAAAVQTQPARTAIVFRHQVPPRHDPRHLSYFGGTPTVPPSFAWPRWTHDGTTEPLHFVMQIDCAAVPPAGGGGAFPAQGILAFFLDLRWGDSNGARVLYVEDVDGPLAPLPAPEDLAAAYGAEARHAWRWTAGLDDPEARCPKLLPQWPFDPIAISVPPALIEAWRAEQGGTDENPVFWWPDQEPMHRALLDAQGEAPVAPGAERTALARPYAAYPQDWRAIEIGAGLLLDQAKRRLRHAISDHALRQLTDDERAAMSERIGAEARQWLAQAAAHAPFDATPQEARDAFWSWLESWRDFALFVIKDGETLAVEAALAESAEAAARIPGEAIDRIRIRHALASRTTSGIFAVTPDRMLAPPSYVQGNEEETAQTHLLLLELSSNDGIAHTFGEGVYQFWIAQEDLQHRRFDRVKLTTTAY